MTPPFSFATIIKVRFEDNLPPPTYHDSVAQFSPRAWLEQFLLNLLTMDWDDPHSPMELSGNLLSQEIENTLFFDQTRRFLRLVGRKQGVGLNARGSLNRASVLLMCQHLQWANMQRQFNQEMGFRRLTEVDIPPLLYIHAVSYHAGLVKKRKGRLYLTKLGRNLLAEENAGSLYRLLFVSFFRHLDLDYLDLLQVPSLQESFAIILWRLSVVADNWIEYSRLPAEILLPHVRQEITEACSTLPLEQMELWIIRSHVIEPLSWFGLMESDAPGDIFELEISSIRVRKTPLFNQFVHFSHPDWRIL